MNQGGHVLYHHNLVELREKQQDRPTANIVSAAAKVQGLEAQADLEVEHHRTVALRAAQQDIQQHPQMLV